MRGSPSRWRGCGAWRAGLDGKAANPIHSEAHLHGEPSPAYTGTLSNREDRDIHDTL
jgi:hypothetical protein